MCGSLNELASRALWSIHTEHNILSKHRMNTYYTFVRNWMLKECVQWNECWIFQRNVEPVLCVDKENMPANNSNDVVKTYHQMQVKLHNGDCWCRCYCCYDLILILRALWNCQPSLTFNNVTNCTNHWWLYFSILFFVVHYFMFLLLLLLYVLAGFGRWVCRLSSIRLVWFFSCIFWNCNFSIISKSIFWPSSSTSYQLYTSVLDN